MIPHVESFGQRMRNARVNAGLSQGDLETMSGIPKTTLSRYENDHILPSTHNLRLLAKFLKADEASLLGLEPGPGQVLLGELRSRGIEISTNAEAIEIAKEIASILEQGPRKISGDQ